MKWIYIYNAPTVWQIICISWTFYSSASPSCCLLSLVPLILSIGGNNGGCRWMTWLAGSMLSQPVSTGSKYRRIGGGDDSGRRQVTWLAGLELLLTGLGPCCLGLFLLVLSIGCSKYRRIGGGNNGGRRWATWLAGLELSLTGLGPCCLGLFPLVLSIGWKEEVMMVVKDGWHCWLGWNCPWLGWVHVVLACFCWF